jgi:hypothetical protein
MEWNGMEWNGMEWNGMEWNGIWNKKVLVHTHTRSAQYLPDFTPHMQTASDSGRRTSR